MEDNFLMVRLSPEEKKLFISSCRRRNSTMSDRVRQLIGEDIEQERDRFEVDRLIDKMGVEESLKVLKPDEAGHSNDRRG